MIVRNATVADAAGLAALLNEIIAIGGTTAHEDPYAAEAIAEDYLTAPAALIPTALSTDLCSGA